MLVFILIAAFGAGRPGPAPGLKSPGFMTDTPSMVDQWRIREEEWGLAFAEYARTVKSPEVSG